MTALIAICVLVTCAGLLLHSWTLYQVTGELRLLGAELRAMLNAIQQSEASEGIDEPCQTS